MRSGRTTCWSYSISRRRQRRCSRTSTWVVTTAVSFEETPPTPDAMAARIRATLEHTPWLTATNGCDVVGFVYASRHRERSAYRWSVDVTAYVHERFRGRGVGQGFRRAHAGVTLPNEASVAFHRALGFEAVGVYRGVGWKLGAWHDVAWFGRAIGADDVAAPPELTPFPTVRGRSRDRADRGRASCRPMRSPARRGSAAQRATSPFRCGATPAPSAGANRA